MKKDDWTGLGVSAGVHLLALLFVGSLVLGSKGMDSQVKLLQIEFGSLASEAAPSAPSDRPDPRPVHDEQHPDPPRQQTATQSPVDPPRTQTPTQSEESITRPQQNESAEPNPPSPNVPDHQTDGGGGAPDGETGRDNNPDNANGQGTEGTSGVAVAGLGNRRADCRRPRYPGVSGVVSFVITFRPDGSYVSSRPQRRGGDQRLNDAVRQIVSSCRADRLPPSADQVNQRGTFTWSFSN